MLTRNGWLVAGLAAGLFAAGRILGVWELYLLGGAAAGLVLASALYVGLVRLRLRVSRRVRPYRIHAGTPARVDLDVRSVGRRTPVLRLRDAVSGTRGADLSAGPLRPGEENLAAYRVPTERRGIVTVGPLVVEIADPFDLAMVSMQAAGETTITVYPAVVPLRPVPFTVGHDPHGAANNPNSVGRLGEDFYALRHYTVGDDLRRVHWPSTAHVGELMVRQDELPWQGRATIVLDTRIRGPMSDDDFEGAVSAVASVLTACVHRRDLVRVVTTDGGDSGFATGHAHVDAIMEFLATVRRGERGTLHGTLTALHRSTDGGALVVVGGALDSSDVDASLRLRVSYGSVYVVRFDLGSHPGNAGTVLAGPSANVLTVGRLEDLADGWNRMTSMRAVSALDRSR
jgi:uncharacterized protein (DUF58 family)